MNKFSFPDFLVGISLTVEIQCLLWARHEDGTGVIFFFRFFDQLTSSMPLTYSTRCVSTSCSKMLNMKKGNVEFCQEKVCYCVSQWIIKNIICASWKKVQGIEMESAKSISHILYVSTHI